jgi:hypothetical protein
MVANIDAPYHSLRARTSLNHLLPTYVRVQMAFRSKPPFFQPTDDILKRNGTRPRWANSGIVIGAVPQPYKYLVEILHNPRIRVFLY